MVRRPPRSTLDRSSSASDVYKRQDEEIDVKEVLSPAEERFERLRHQAGFFLAPFVFFVIFFAPLDPVSYTHLRAHETVLDLVCRLLLEKKKNKKEKPNSNT